MHHTPYTACLVMLLPLVGCASSDSDVALSALDFPAERVEENHAKAELVFEANQVDPGNTTWIGVRFTIADGWHLYWNGQNETGSPPTFSPELPPGYSLGDWVWPAPKRHVAPGEILDHIYERSVLVMAPLKVPTDANVDGSVSIKIALNWVVCDSNMCVAESGTVSAPVPKKDRQLTPALDPAFAAARASHPKVWPTGSEGFVSSVERREGKAIAKLRVAGATSLEFYPTTDGFEIEGLVRKGAIKGDSLTLVAAAAGDRPFAGVVAVGRNGQRVSEFYSVNVSVPTAAKSGS